MNNDFDKFVLFLYEAPRSRFDPSTHIPTKARLYLIVSRIIFQQTIKLSPSILRIRLELEVASVTE